MKVINKKNTYLLFLMVVSLLAIVIVPTYAKFGSSYDTTDDVVSMALDFNVTITDVEEYERITISANSRKRFDVKVSNSSTTAMYYGIWYRMLEPSVAGGNISIGKSAISSTATSGLVAGSNSVTANIIVVNNSTSDIIIDIGVSSSTTSTSDIEYLDGKKLISGQITLLLSEVAAGSYVQYIGNNNCTGASCSGQNANYVSDTNMGYCYSSGYRFHVNGWRVAYVDDNGDDDSNNDNAILVSAGALECMCTSRNGNASNSGCSTGLLVTDISKHYVNMNNIALKYCNSAYIKGEVCDSSAVSSGVVHAMNESDFQQITDNSLSYCFDFGSVNCGYANDLIDNGGFYWFATLYTSSNSFLWLPSRRVVFDNPSNLLYGVRPVLTLASSVIVTDGSGTYADPYIISN